MATIYTRIEAARGCGYRKPGGMYLVSDGIGKPCCRLPFPLTVCPCCGQGIKQTRGFMWVTAAIFDGDRDCENCILARPRGEFALMWVGEKFYKTSAAFSREAIARGVSKRIATIPHKLKIGTTWVLLAHPRAIAKIVDGGEHARTGGGVEYTPGIFQAFKPTRVEYIITGDESSDELADLERRGLTLIKLVRDIDVELKLIDDVNGQTDHL